MILVRNTQLANTSLCCRWLKNEPYTITTLLSSASHIVFTTGGNDLDIEQSISQIIFNNNFASVANKADFLKAQLVLTYKLIKGAVPYVDFFSVANNVPNEDDCHRAMELLSNTVKNAAKEAGIGFIEPVKTAFVGHEMFSTDPYTEGFSGLNALHSNIKGYYKIGQVIAEYLRTH